jgi:OOP family OmpA-OmpF porin
MRAFLVLLVFVAYALGARWYFFCELRGLCGDQEEEVDNRLKSLRLHENDTVLLQGYDQFAFDSARVRPDMNTNNRLFLDSVAALLRGMPKKSLEITSLYRPSETDPVGYFENIGLARADYIRKELVRRGIKEDRIDLDYGFSDTEELAEPLDFEIFPTVESAGRLSYTITNMTFSDANFEFDSDVFKPGSALLSYLDTVKLYLEVNPDNKITITGHTDRIGRENYNYTLGIRRAENARAYLKEKIGITAPIEVNSMGEKDPIANNNTAAGRQKNRRVNFKISPEDESS